jgi:hypothetical protein
MREAAHRGESAVAVELLSEGTEPTQTSSCWTSPSAAALARQFALSMMRHVGADESSVSVMCRRHSGIALDAADLASSKVLETRR